MAECKECLYYEVCADFRRNICETDQKRFEEYRINYNGICDNFKNKADFVEVVRCRDCKHKVNYIGRVMCSKNAYILYGAWCGLTATEENHFCSYGEKRSEKK